jgi:hypothetical protein
MPDIIVSLQTAALVAALLVSNILTILAYRQAFRDRDRLLDERGRVLEERDARLVDLWRDMEEKEIRIATLEAANERLQRLATDATEGWRLSVEQERARMT